MFDDMIGGLDSYVKSGFQMAKSFDESFDSISGILEDGFYTFDQILDRIPDELLPADVRRYMDDGEGWMNKIKGIKSDIFNSYLYNLEELYELVTNWDGTYSDAIMMKARPKPKSVFDGWTTAQQNFWEVRILSRDKGRLPKYFAVLPALDCSLSMGECEITAVTALNQNIYYQSSQSSGSNFSITFLDDESHSIMKFLRAWMESTSPRPGVYVPLEKAGLDMEFRKFNRMHKEMFYRRVKVMPAGELSLNFSAVADDDVQTPFEFKIVGEETK